ncbi:methylthioribose-1-phosphate isomerase [Modicisalibacter muralis]|uniref:Methylthioribose-1-phosphate isomerase n=1 Tax=Modicisalibacter muralis TaxID=119000 RepID=A0A1G9GEK5_9GAMM|nr:S-methyl-5-thioribose-1-phosphate isomerase [Halomonas muralis]SDK99005.1 methylthioribose-1-phosphate isomerase [Halomonas muralis]
MTASTIVPIRWCGDALELLDQRALPDREIRLRVNDATQTAQAITDMVVRGAPAIGITAAYGVALAAQRAEDSDWPQRLEDAIECLAASRPTAVNLFWALARMRGVIDRHRTQREAPVAALLDEAREIHQRDLADNLAMGRYGSELIARNGTCTVMTHCNTGALATGGHGTALGVIRSAWEQGLITLVHANETRPWLQGARLTAWELQREGIPVVLAADSAASLLLARGEIDWLIVGADRIAANGDVANKIGTYALAVQARHHGVKVMVVAPSSTFDLDLESGADIPIETRDSRELTHQGERRVAPENVKIFNPVFDITPAALIDAIVCEHGVIEPPNPTSIARLLGRT